MTFLSHKADSQHSLLKILTAGSVDDGKSTLIGRLLFDSQLVYEDHLESLQRDSVKRGLTLSSELDYSLLTDGLKAEREQGITIDVAYRYFATPKRKFIIADTPGHEQYTRNMATAASTADLLLLVVNAERGILPQTKRHTYIAALMGIRKVVLLVNKMDCVNYSQCQFMQVMDDYRKLLEQLPEIDAHFMPISALHGHNIVSSALELAWFQEEPLLSYLENVFPHQECSVSPLRFPIQLVLRSQEARGYAGTIASGKLRCGDQVTVLPSGTQSKIAAISCAGRKVNEAGASEAVVVHLSEELDISRGDMLVPLQDKPLALRHIDAMLIWMDSEKAGELNGSYLLKHTTQSMPATLQKLWHKIDVHTFASVAVTDSTPSKITLNDICKVTLALTRPIFCEPYVFNRSLGCFILIDPLTNLTIAAGMLCENQSAFYEVKSKNLFPPQNLLLPSQREKLLGQKGCVIWLTGLSAAGKTTIAAALEKQLVAQGNISFILDGDEIRSGLNRDLGFSLEDRREHIRRTGEVAALFANAGLVAVVALISPERQGRELARQRVPAGRFFEVHVSTPLSCCEGRDPKGLYKKARAGEVADFPGISIPYEPPLYPDLCVDAAKMNCEAAVAEIVALLQSRDLL